MSKAYGTSNKSTGRTKTIDAHPGSNKAGASEEHFSNMKVVDTDEHHVKSINNMAAQPTHIKALNIDQNHSYKKQSHAVKPAGEIKSFVGNRVDADLSAKTKTLRPHGGKGEVGGKDRN